VKKWAIIIASLWGVLISADSASAQELEPRIYAPAPVGMTIVLAGVGGSKGGILLDPCLDVANVEADLTIVTAGVGLHVRTGRTASASARSLPIASGDIRGDVHILAERQPLDGLANPRIRLSVGPAAHPRARPPTWPL